MACIAILPKKATKSALFGQKSGSLFEFFVSGNLILLVYRSSRLAYFLEHFPVHVLVLAV